MTKLKKKLNEPIKRSMAVMLPHVIKLSSIKSKAQIKNDMVKNGLGKQKKVKKSANKLGLINME